MAAATARCSASGSEVSASADNRARNVASCGTIASPTAAMLSADPAADPVYFVDDHFVPDSGARPVGKGWNTNRRHAQPGRADTLLTDARGRAVVFGSGEPSGLTSTLPGVLTGLREVLGPDAPVLLAFDRGGAYPAAFTACRQAGADWVTYRRGALVEVTAPARRSWTRRVSGLNLPAGVSHVDGEQALAFV